MSENPRGNLKAIRLSIAVLIGLILGRCLDWSCRTGHSLYSRSAAFISIS